MNAPRISRRQALKAGTALAVSASLPRMAFAADEIVATTYPGSFEEAYRAILLPAFSERSGGQAVLTPLLAINQVAKISAARNNPPYDVVIFDEGPLLASLGNDILVPYPSEQSAAFAELPEVFQGHNSGGFGPTVTVQIIVMAYNPKKVSAPTDWLDMWDPEYKGGVGLTGMASSLGTSYMTEITKRLGGGRERLRAGVHEDEGAAAERRGDSAEPRRACRAVPDGRSGYRTELLQQRDAAQGEGRRHRLRDPTGRARAHSHEHARGEEHERRGPRRSSTSIPRSASRCSRNCSIPRTTSFPPTRTSR